MAQPPFDIVALEALIGAGLLGVSVWLYRRTPRDRSGHVGRVLWVAWVVFLALSLIILVATGLGALVLGGILTWVFCVAGTVLGSRMLVRSHRNREQDIWALTLVFALGSVLLGFFLALLMLSSALRHSA